MVMRVLYTRNCFSVERAPNLTVRQPFTPCAPRCLPQVVPRSSFISDRNGLVRQESVTSSYSASFCIALCTASSMAEASMSLGVNARHSRTNFVTGEVLWVASHLSIAALE